ncbi:MAG: L7Ae/L30e/S12e/Gadd45 family ribosomal protein [Eubacteriales bacterium]|nr:L7Ae/L30e/S12e/Gadd45 family ribosomal protein [Eubacteriales bacterium]
MTQLDQTPEAIYRLIGLSRRAGRLVLGSEAVEKAARNGQLSLLILAGDAGPNTTGRMEQVSRVTQTPLLVVGDRQILGHWTGQRERVVAGLSDQGFAGKILSLSDTRTKQESDK